MAKPEYEFFDPSGLERRPVANVAGLSESILSEDPETGDYARVLYFAPGTDTTDMGVQRHDFWEEVWIVEGSFEDLSLGETFSTGMYACRPPGMAHGPWRSIDGCKTFELRYYR